MNRTSVALCLLLLPALLFAQAYQWTTFTSTSNVVDLKVSQDTIWTATSGGLSGYAPASGQFDIYTNTRGLAMNQCVAVGKDARGFVWAGLGDARITRINPQTGEVRQTVDLANDVFEITDILEVGDEVFVSANNGIYRFSYYPAVDNYRVLESIRVLGGFPGEARVSCLAVAGGYLYAGTASGLARASLNETQLNAPGVWQNFTVGNSPLPENSIVALQGYAGEQAGLLNIATSSWVASLQGDTWSTQQLGGVIDFASDYHWAVSTADQRVYHVDAPHGAWQAVGAALAGVARIEVLPVSGQSTVAVGLADSDHGSGGLVFSVSPADVAWTPAVRVAGIGGNYITALEVDPQGRLWAGGQGFTTGVYVRSGDSWTNFDRSSGYSHAFFVYIPTSFAFDDYGGTWVGSMGGGVGWFHGLDSITYINDFGDESGYAMVNGSLQPRLTGIEQFPRGGYYYVETYVARDALGDICITNLEAYNGQALTIAPASWIAQGNNTAPWPVFLPHSIQGGASWEFFKYVGRVLADPLNRIWLGPGRNGGPIFVLDPRTSLSDTTNDLWVGFRANERRDLTTCFEEITPEVLTMAVDRQGYLWAGTINGAYYTQGGISYDANATRFICVSDLPVGRRVNAIHVDAQDNKWFGTDNGVAVLDKNFNWIYVFQTSNSVDHPSGLISNSITAITSNPVSGEVWIGTSDGLSRFASPFVATDPALDKLWPYPNPFRADGTQHLRVDPARLGGRFDQMKVLTINGRLVRKLSWEQMTDPSARGGWDGRNEDNELVAGGVYLLVVSSSEGESAVGKVAVLGR